jgi:hypothetical protein
MNAIPFGKGVPAFGKAARQGFGRKGGATGDDSETSKQDGGALDTAHGARGRKRLQGRGDGRDLPAGDRDQHEGRATGAVRPAHHQ